jgi:hypothetical protein
MSPERREGLQKMAEKLSETLPLAEKEQFITDYMSVMVGLNEKIDARIDIFEAEVMPVMTALVPRSPKAVTAAKDTHAKTIKEVVELVMSELSSIGPLAIRVMVADALIDVLGMCSEALVQTHIKAEKRTGIEVM